jgi:hypothetical protein
MDATFGLYPAAANAGFGTAAAYGASLQLSCIGSVDIHNGGGGMAPAVVEADGEVHVPVECGGMAGLLAVSRLRIIMNPGTASEREVSPTQFERLGGKGASKKWRLSIHVANSECPVAGCAAGCRAACVARGTAAISW